MSVELNVHRIIKMITKDLTTLIEFWKDRRYDTNSSDFQHFINYDRDIQTFISKVNFQLEFWKRLKSLEDDTLDTEVDQQNITTVGCQTEEQDENISSDTNHQQVASLGLNQISEDTMNDLGHQRESPSKLNENQLPSFRITDVLDFKPEIVEELHSGINMSKYYKFLSLRYVLIFFSEEEPVTAMSDNNEINNTESQAESETIVTDSNQAKKKKLEIRDSCPFCKKIMNTKSLKRHIQRMHNETEELNHEMDQNEDDTLNTEVDQQNISTVECQTEEQDGNFTSDINHRISEMLDVKPELHTGMILKMSKYLGIISDFVIVF